MHYVTSTSQQPTTQPPSHPPTQPTNQPISHPANQPVTQPASHPASQSVAVGVTVMRAATADRYQWGERACDLVTGGGLNMGTLRGLHLPNYIFTSVFMRDALR